MTDGQIDRGRDTRQIGRNVGKANRWINRQSGKERQIKRQTENVSTPFEPS